MKQLVILALLVGIILSVVAGCRQVGRDVEVIVEGGGQFPEFLVGTWRADTDGWEFVFDADGRISSAVISLGRIRLKPGGVTTVPMREGSKGVFKPGEWMVYYIPDGRDLTVNISLKHFSAELGGGILEGRSKDVFFGPISEDGRVWEAAWTSFPDYTAHTPERSNYKLPTDLVYGMSKHLIFKKVLR